MAKQNNIKARNSGQLKQWSPRLPYHGAPFPQALVTLDHQLHQLYSGSTQVMAHRPVQFI